MSEKHKKNVYLKYVEHLLILTSTVTGYISISGFSSLVAISAGITSSAVGIKVCAITAGIKSISQLQRKRRKSMIK